MIQSQKDTLSKWLPRITALEIQDDLEDNLNSLLDLCTSLRDLKIKIYRKDTLRQLKKMKKLKSIELSTSIPFGDVALMYMYLRRFPITSLSLEDCRTSNRRRVYLKKLPLKQLRLTFSPDSSINDVGLSHLKELPLAYLDIKSGWHITDQGFSYLQGMPLGHLDLGVPLKVTDEGLAYLSKLPFLESLNLKHCINITNRGLANLKDLPLRRLNLENCVGIKDQGLVHLKAMPLEYLNLNSCALIRGKGLTHLTNLPLSELDLRGCRSLEVKKSKIRKMFPRTKVSL
ncbi:MAG: hypothetical protein ACSNEK_00250 [Parachlamydiaceae bacterium]